VWNIPAGGSKVRQYNVQTVNWLGATLRNRAEVQPKNAVDLRYYDNHATSAEVVIEGEGSLLFLPIVTKP
jgi:hypothetical protein